MVAVFHRRFEVVQNRLRPERPDESQRLIGNDS